MLFMLVARWLHRVDYESRISYCAPCLGERYAISILLSSSKTKTKYLYVLLSVICSNMVLLGLSPYAGHCK